MKLHTILILIVVLGTSNLFADEYYGYINSATNNFAGSDHKFGSTLYIKNTDPHPGKINNGDGNSLAMVHTGAASPKFDNVAVPWDRFGGKIYVWLVDNATKRVINAAKLYDKDDHIYFDQDSALIPNPSLAIRKRGTRNGLYNKCSQNDTYRAEIIPNQLFSDANFNYWDKYFCNVCTAGSPDQNQMHNVLVDIMVGQDGALLANFTCNI